MSRVDRAVRRVRQHLDGTEALVASAWGVEADGRRARVVVVTDRRVLVGWRRPAAPDVLAPTAQTSWDPREGLLTLEDGDVTVRLRDVDRREGQQVVDLLGHRAARPLAERIGDAFHVRVLGA